MALAEQFDAYYAFLRMEADALAKLYNEAPLLFEEDMEEGNNRDKRNAFMTALRVRSEKLHASENRAKLSEKIVIFQRKLVNFVS